MCGKNREVTATATVASRPAWQVHQEILMNQLRHDHAAAAVQGDYSISVNTRRDSAMTYDEQKQELDARLIILGFGYATFIIVAIGWVATLVL